MPLKTISSILFMLLCAGCTGGSREVRTSAAHPFMITLHDPSGPREQEYRTMLEGAVNIVDRKFSDWGFEGCHEGYFDGVVVVEGGLAGRARLATILGIDSASIPSSFAGTISGRVLFLVPPAAYRAIWTSLYPEWSWSDTATYRSLLIHEIAHAEHAWIARSLYGTEDAMGPQWFYEGLAMAVAGQFPLNDQHQVEMSKLEVNAFLKSPQDAGHKYPAFARVVATLLKHYAPRELFDHAKSDSLTEFIGTGAPNW